MAGTIKPDLTTSRIWANGATGGDINDPGVPMYVTGWQLKEVPTFPNFNFLQQQFTQGLVYNNEQGVNEWDTNTIYPINALVKGTDGIIYRALTQQGGNNPATGSINWLSTTDATTTDLIARDLSALLTETLFPTGFSVKGGGGAAPWKHNGNVGQPASQSPAQLGDALFNDVDGNQFAIVDDDINTVLAVGVIGDKVADDKLAFIAVNTHGGKWHIPKPSVGYLLATTLNLDNVAVSIDENATWDEITDNGKLVIAKGFRPDTGNGSNIHRFTDRVFIGEAASHVAGTSLPDAGDSWLDNATDGPAYLIANGQLVVMTRERRYAIVGATKTSLAAGAGEAIGLAGVVINDGVSPNDSNGWGLIIEGQHETTTKKTFGIEIALKNSSGNDISTTPSTDDVNATVGLLLAGGGDDAFGPTATDPCTSGIVFTTNNSQGWNNGIQFRVGSIVGAEPEAIAFANGYAMKWYESPTSTVTSVIKSTNNTAATKQSLIFQTNALNLTNNAGNSVFFIEHSATDVNRVQIAAATAGNPPKIDAAGSDTNIDLRLNSKGTGRIRFGSRTAIGAESITGFIEIKDASGVVRKLAVVS